MLAFALRLSGLNLAVHNAQKIVSFLFSDECFELQVCNGSS